MSLTGGFFNSKNHDRRYNAETISRLFDGIIEDGVYETYGDKFIVRQASGMDVTIGSGRAWFDHCWIHNDTKYRIAIDSSEVVLDRLDTIVIDVDHSTSVRAVSFKVVRGIPASSPVAAELVNEEDHKQHPICRILVKAGATEITDANITNLVGTSECPFVIGVLKVLKADELLAQWASDYSQWKAANDNDFKKWQASEEAAFMEWLSDITGSIDPGSDVATQIITELNNIKMRYKAVTIEPSDWESCDETFNGLTYHAKKNIPVIGVTENATACWLEITSGAALYQEALVSGLGSFTIYSEEAEEVDMHFRIWFIGKADSGDPTPTQLDEITTTVAELAGKLQTEVDDLTNSVGDVKRQICTNILNPTAPTQTMNGVTFTNNGDGTYTVNGTARDVAYITIFTNLSVSVFQNKKNVGCPTGGSSETYFLSFVCHNGNTWLKEFDDYGENGIVISNIPSNANKVSVRIMLRKGTTVNNLLFKPMLTTDLSATYDDFVPYTGDSGRLNEDISDANGRLTQVQSQIVPTASIESGETASKAYSKGDFLVKNGVLYKVTNAIAEGDALTVGENIDSTTVVDELSEIKPSVQLSLDAVAVGKDEDGDTIYEKTFKGTTISKGTVVDSNLTFSNVKWFRLVGGCFSDNDTRIFQLPYDATLSGSRYNFIIYSNSKGLVVDCTNVNVKMYHFTVQYVLK